MLKSALVLLLAGCGSHLWAARPGAKLPTWSAGQSVDLGTYIQCPDTSTQVYRLAGVSISVSAQEEITLEGKSKLGKAWSVRSSYPGDIPCRFYRYDLDRNGSSDFIFVIPNGGSGPAGITLVVIAFDSRGFPVPWQASGPFLPGPKGVENFIDGDGDGRAELLYQYAEEHGRDRVLIRKTTLYKITEGEFYPVRAFKGHSFPVFEPYRVPLPEAPDLTNLRAAGFGVNTRNTKVRTRQRPCGIAGIKLGVEGIVLNDDGERLECGGYITGDGAKKIPLPMMIVLDRDDGTRFVDIEYSIAETTRQIVESRRAVVFVGRSCEAGCRPLVMWAFQSDRLVK